MSKVLVIGAGGVGSVAVHKMAMNADIFPDITLASRRKFKCDAVAESVKARTGVTIDTAQVDADNVPELVALIKQVQPGLVVNLARRGIRHLTGFTAVQPLSGMRCVGPRAFDAAAPLARGWGVETALTVDVLRAGLSVLEVPCELQHRVSGSDWRGQLHRAGQYRDVWLALVARGWRPWHRD